jgi:hypothetical protein
MHNAKEVKNPKKKLADFNLFLNAGVNLNERPLRENIFVSMEKYHLKNCEIVKHNYFKFLKITFFRGKNHF